MQTKHGDSQAPKFGDAVVASFDLGNAVATDRTTASELAARHLERVLVRGTNTRLVAALADLARELAPPRIRVARFNITAVAWASGQLAAAR